MSSDIVVLLPSILNLKSFTSSAVFEADLGNAAQPSSSSHGGSQDVPRLRRKSSTVMGAEENTAGMGSAADGRLQRRKSCSSLSDVPEVLARLKSVAQDLAKPEHIVVLLHRSRWCDVCRQYCMDGKERMFRWVQYPSNLTSVSD